MSTTQTPVGATAPSGYEDLLRNQLAELHLYQGLALCESHHREWSDLFYGPFTQSRWDAFARAVPQAAATVAPLWAELCEAREPQTSHE